MEPPRNLTKLRCSSMFSWVDFSKERTFPSGGGMVMPVKMIVFCALHSSYWSAARDITVMLTSCIYGACVATFYRTFKLQVCFSSVDIVRIGCNVQRCETVKLNQIQCPKISTFIFKRSFIFSNLSFFNGHSSEIVICTRSKLIRLT